MTSSGSFLLSMHELRSTEESWHHWFHLKTSYHIHHVLSEIWPLRVFTSAFNDWRALFSKLSGWEAKLTSDLILYEEDCRSGVREGSKATITLCSATAVVRGLQHESEHWTHPDPLGLQKKAQRSAQISLNTMLLLLNGEQPPSSHSHICQIINRCRSEWGSFSKLPQSHKPTHTHTHSIANHVHWKSKDLYSKIKKNPFY